MKSKMALIWVLGAALTGCASPAPRLDTPSGRPQEFYPHQTIATLQNLLIAVAARGGMTIAQQTPNTLVIQKPMHGFMNEILLGSPANPTPDRQMTLTFAQIPGGTEIFASEAYVTNPGTPVAEIDPDRGADPALQKLLEKIKSVLAQQGARQ